MQKLLTGKIRLPGFNGEWESKVNIIGSKITEYQLTEALK